MQTAWRQRQAVLLCAHRGRTVLALIIGQPACTAPMKKPRGRNGTRGCWSHDRRRWALAAPVDHMWSIITWKSHLSPRRITLRPRWHPPSPVKGPSIGNPPTFIGGARCTFVTWPNTEQDRRQCSSKDPAVKPLAGSHRNGHRPPGKRSSSAGLLSGRLVFYTVLRLPASDWTKR